MNACVITPMTANDLDWVCAEAACLHAHPWTRRNFEDALAAGNDAWVMHAGGEALAYAVVLRVLDEAHLLDIGVSLRAQGRGYGRQLLDWIADFARDQGAVAFFLEVRVSNATALALYERSGFSEIGRRRGYYPAVDGREDAIVMRRDL